MPITTSNFMISGAMDAGRILLNGKDLIQSHVVNYLIDKSAVGNTECLYAVASSITENCCLGSSDLYRLSHDVNNTGNDKVELYNGEGTWQLQNIILYTKVGSKLFICGEWVRIL